MNEEILQVLKLIDTTASQKTDEELVEWINLSIIGSEEAFFGDYYVQAMAYLTASKIQDSIIASKQTQNAQTGLGGIQEVREGEISVRYFQENSSSSSTSQTKSNSSVFRAEYERIYAICLSKQTSTTSNTPLFLYD